MENKDMAKEDWKEMIDYQSHLGMVNWVIKFLIIIATGAILVLAGWLGYYHYAQNVADSVTQSIQTTFDSIDMEQFLGGNADGTVD